MVEIRGTSILEISSFARTPELRRNFNGLGFRKLILTIDYRLRSGLFLNQIHALMARTSGYVSGVVAWPLDILISQLAAALPIKCQVATLPCQRSNQMVPTLAPPILVTDRAL